MKRFYSHAIFGIALCATFMSCSKADAPEQEPNKGINIDTAYGDSIETKALITFACTGDFTLQTKAMTRALTADGKDMTDLWLLDYIGNELKQTIHQTESDADFGSPTVPLALGRHHLYFIATRGTGATFDTDTHTMMMDHVSDTFYKAVEINVGNTLSGTQAVELERIVTKLKIVLNDAIPEGADKVIITPDTWYHAIDYLTGEPSAATTAQPFTISIPPGDVGTKGEQISIFGFSGSTEWNTGFSVVCKDSSGGVLGSATVGSAPLQRNRVTEFSGTLFSGSSSFSVSLLSSWDDSYTSTWN